jgi:ClpP class serine protease
MNWSALFWILFFIIAFQPVYRQWRLQVERRRLIAEIEQKRGSRVILLVHRQETMSLLGIPIFRYIDINDSEEIIRAIYLTGPDVPIDIVLHTPGGLALASLQIAYALKRHQGKVTAFVPHYAMSGGTLIALAADEIQMGEHSVLGPVDPQVGEYPAVSVLKVVREKPIEKIDDKTLIYADVAGKAMHQMQENLKSLLAGQCTGDRADEIARTLSEGRWTHDYPVTFDEAKKIGLCVSSDVPKEIYQLMTLFPQPIRRFPSVEYLPGAHRSGGH